MPAPVSTKTWLSAVNFTEVIVGDLARHLRVRGHLAIAAARLDPAEERVLRESVSYMNSVWRATRHDR